MLINFKSLQSLIMSRVTTYIIQIDYKTGMGGEFVPWGKLFQQEKKWADSICNWQHILVIYILIKFFDSTSIWYQ